MGRGIRNHYSETGSKDAKNTLDGKAEEGDADPGMG